MLYAIFAIVVGLVAIFLGKYMKQWSEKMQKDYEEKKKNKG